MNPLPHVKGHHKGRFKLEQWRVFAGRLHQDQLPTCQSLAHSIHHSHPDFPAVTTGSPLTRSLAVLLGANHRSKKEWEALGSFSPVTGTRSQQQLLLQNCSVNLATRLCTTQPQCQAEGGPHRCLVTKRFICYLLLQNNWFKMSSSKKHVAFTTSEFKRIRNPA